MKATGKNLESIMILKNSHTPPSLTFLSMNTLNSDDKLSSKVGKYFGGNPEKWPPTIRNLRDHMAFTALGMAISYLE
jgi:hypothetical protein